jgi:hypothetical protein
MTSLVCDTTFCHSTLRCGCGTATDALAYSTESVLRTGVYIQPVIPLRTFGGSGKGVAHFQFVVGRVVRCYDDLGGHRQGLCTLVAIPATTCGPASVDLLLDTGTDKWMATLQEPGYLIPPVYVAVPKAGLKVLVHSAYSLVSAVGMEQGIRSDGPLVVNKNIIQYLVVGATERPELQRPARLHGMHGGATSEESPSDGRCTTGRCQVGCTGCRQEEGSVRGVACSLCALFSMDRVSKSRDTGITGS